MRRELSPRVLESDTWPLDFNPVENAIRPFVIGGRDAKANGIEPYRYIAALFKKLPLAQTADDYEALLLWNITLPVA